MEEIEFVNPVTWNIIWETQKVLEEGIADDADATAADLKVRRQALQTQLEAALVLLPVYATDHWGLLIVKKGEAGKRH
eukprot:12671093-Heterocapsa_arctica.AAC.1